AGRARPRRGVPGRGRVPLAHRPDRRADRLPALHAAPDPGELPSLVDRRRTGGPGLGDLRRGQADRRAVPGRLHHRERRRRRRRGQPAGAPVPHDLPRDHAAVGGDGAGRGAGRDQPDQDQPDERLLRLAGLDQLLHPGDEALPRRLVFLGVNLLIALVLMEANMFDFLNAILGFYANCGMSWVVVVATDIAVNKYLLKISPMRPEFRRGMLYAVNPVGFGS